MSTGVNVSAKLCREEIFGPILVLSSFKTEEEVIKRANDTEYSSIAGVFTQYINKAMRVASEFESGMVGINCVTLAVLNTPFSGSKR